MLNGVVQITLADGLMLPSGFVAPAAYACIIFCRVGPDWLAGAQVSEAKVELVLENLYGAGWRAGNADGSRYVVRSLAARVLTPAEEEAAPWQGVSNDAQYHYWFYHVTPAGQLEQVAATNF